MRNIILSVITLGSICFSTGCASTARYFADRGRDLRDTITISGESAGVSVDGRIGSLATGLGFQHGKGLGMRSGAAGVYEHMELGMIFAQGTVVIPSEIDKQRGKGFEINCVWPPFATGHNEGLVQGEWHNWFQIEVGACIGIGARAGVNLAELVDFILGWSTVDICCDDIEQRRERIRIEPVAAPLPSEGAPSEGR